MTFANEPTAGLASLEEALLRVLAAQARRIPLPVFVVAAMIAALAAQHLPLWICVGWLALVAAVLLARFFVLGRLPANARLTVAGKLRVAIALSALNGVVHGLSLGFFPFLPEFERAIQTMLLVGLGVGAIATTAGFLPVFVVYLAPTVFPLAALWALSPGVAQRGWIEGAIAAIVTLSGIIMIALARDAFQLFRTSFEIRTQQAALNRRLEAALEKAEAASRAKTRFLAAASHDLRQPIHTLSLFGAALAMCNLDARTRQISEHMNVALRALASQFDALLDVSKLDAGVVRVNRGPIPLAGFLARLGDEFAPAARAKGIALAIDCPPVECVDCDRMLLERILRNLLDNAIKYTERGEVRIAAAMAADDVVLTVADTGRGIPESEHARVFEEFYQLDNPERDRTKGFGLGLAIVKRLSDLLQLGMQMSSAPGQGTAFRFVLPRVAAPAAGVDDRGDDTRRLRGMHILVVDDEDQVRIGMKTLLESLGCRTTLVDGTTPAVAAARAEKPDVVLADFRLRGEDNGIVAVQSIRRIFPAIPAILLSGDTAPDRLREAEAAGIPLLHKPVAVETLAHAISAAGGRSAGAST
jgi:signal transduction histidine kinase/ActR/RegA family two-component response regulator